MAVGDPAFTLTAGGGDGTGAYHFVSSSPDVAAVSDAGALTSFALLGLAGVALARVRKKKR